jgi:methionyl-tRNA formyltransferase
VPRLGFINVHASLLPRWRGAAPVHRAILAGDVTTGVTIMRVVLALDAGPILAAESTDIAPNETSAELEARLAAMGADLLRATVDRLEAGSVAGEPQDDRLATYAPRLDARERAIDWARPAQVVHNQIRGLQPWPGAAARLLGRRILFRRSVVEHERPLPDAPGTIVGVRADAFSIAARPGAVRIVELQAEGGASLDARAFLAGHRLTVGERFEPDEPARRVGES